MQQVDWNIITCGSEVLSLKNETVIPTLKPNQTERSPIVLLDDNDIVIYRLILNRNSSDLLGVNITAKEID